MPSSSSLYCVSFIAIILQEFSDSLQVVRVWIAFTEKTQISKRRLHLGGAVGHKEFLPHAAIPLKVADYDIKF